MPATPRMIIVDATLTREAAHNLKQQMEALLADAWDEGRAAGIRQADWEYGRVRGEFVAVNPYRTEGGN